MRRHATLTAEDLDIWVRRPMEQSGHRTPGWLRLDARNADRWDADMMLEAQQNQHTCYVGPVEQPWKWVRVRGGMTLADMLREAHDL